LIDIAPRQGTTVTNINVSDQLLLLEARRELERLIATSAARRRTHEQSAMLAKMAIEMRRAAATDDYLLFLRIDRAFNQCVGESAANRHLLKAISPIHALARRFWYKHHRPYDLSIAAIAHAEIMEAIVSSNPIAAAKASDALLDYARDLHSISRNICSWQRDHVTSPRRARQRLTVDGARRSHDFPFRQMDVTTLPEHGDRSNSPSDICDGGRHRTLD
jgi:DNA-binding GntR family transcriptional regulator